MRNKLLSMAILLMSNSASPSGSEASTAGAMDTLGQRNSVATPMGVRTGSERREQTMQIRPKADGTVLTARLEDNTSARDFAAMLPLKVTLKDYASIEKIADLPKRLSVEDASAGTDPEIGDIAYYAPWGNLAIYYRDFNYSRGLVRLGRIDATAEQIMSLDGPVTIEVAGR